MSVVKKQKVLLPAVTGNFDEFFDRQPEPLFIDDLKKPVHEKKPDGFGKRAIEPDEIDMSGMYLDIAFPDSEGLLETAYKDFKTFLEVYEAGGKDYSVTIRKSATSCFEEYRVTVTPDGCTVEADDTEGIRRGLVYLEDLIIKSEAPFLPYTDTTRRPVIKSRITRGFFSPTNRPPKNIDELWDDIDYYPDEYLNRLAHDGNNGLWIYTHFKDLIPSRIITEYGEGSERRIEKLKKVVKKCALYGIKVYVFAVEPWGLDEELLEKYRDIIGSPGFNKNAFCTRSERGRDYCIESVQWLFEQVPDLGGYIDITAGERVTCCPSAGNIHLCPRCSKYSRGETLAYTADLIREGMRRAGAKGEFISWTYGHREWDFDDIREYVRKSPDDVMLMQNFEDVGYNEQLGKDRFAEDYWLSYPGPSYMFEETAMEANKHNKHIYAKMQVCCSHELASMPYIPVPGLVFRKYKGAYKYNVEGILQCWYFGNYPSIMSKAAGELSFTEDFSDEKAFLLHLAGICYGQTNAPAIAEAWSLFGEGYHNYPTNIMMSYYGPMHDGVVWELQLKPKNLALPRTWRLTDKPNGDFIGDALHQGHTLDEVIELSGRMRDIWEKGIEMLPRGITGEMETVADGLNVLFRSGRNILEFYRLREKLGWCEGNAEELLGKMRELVHKEIANSREMIEICENDVRLGYHSEAEGFKFFPEKLEHRINQLEELINTEFEEVAQRIADGKIPLEYYGTEGKEFYVVTDSPETSKLEEVGEEGHFKMYMQPDGLHLDIKAQPENEIMFCFEHALMHPECEMHIAPDGKPFIPLAISVYVPRYGEEVTEECNRYIIEKTADGFHITLPKDKFEFADPGTPFKMCIKIDGDPWIFEETPTYTLGKHNYSHDEFGWVIIE